MLLHDIMKTLDYVDTMTLFRPRESNVLEWRFLITGTEKTDYEGGYYHGKLIFPPQYPMKPPQVMLSLNHRHFD